MAAGQHPLRDLLHGATHRVPGVPAHVEQPAGHQGPANEGRPAAPVRSPRPARPVRGRSHNHSPVRPPRVLAGWQRRVARLFGQDV